MTRSSLITNPLIIRSVADYYIKTKLEDRWNLFVQTSEKPQRKYRVKLREVFDNQLDDILSNLNRKSVKADESIGYVDENNLADWNKYRIIYNEFGQLELPGIMTAWASLELEALEVGVSFDVLNPNVMSAVTNKSNLFSDSVINETRDLLHRVITDSIQAGDGIPQLEKKIRLLYSNMSKFRSVRIARTEAIWGLNEGAEQGYIQSGVVEGKKWLCAHDERLCPWCAEMGSRDPIPVGTNYFNRGDVLELPKPEKILKGIEITTAHDKFIYEVYNKYQKAGSIRFTFSYEDIRHSPLHPFADAPSYQLCLRVLKYMLFSVNG
jgi:hypothetical protein